MNKKLQELCYIYNNRIPDLIRQTVTNTLSFRRKILCFRIYKAKKNKKRDSDQIVQNDAKFRDGNDEPMLSAGNEFINHVTIPFFELK